MPSTLDWLVAGAAAGGLLWYARRSQREAHAEVDTAARIAALAEARTRFESAVAQADRAVAAGNAAATSPSRSSGLTRQFDALFAQHGAGIPVPYLRALANAESGMKPDDPLGLINVVKVALDDFNRRHPGTPVTAAQMRDPATNIRVAADTLLQIIASFERNHGDISNLRTDWSNPRFVELVTFGWNAGFSERAGVGRVVRYLKAQPAAKRRREITIDTIFGAARSAGAAEHLANPRKLSYSKGVAAAFHREVARDASDAVGTSGRA